MSRFTHTLTHLSYFLLSPQRCIIMEGFQTRRGYESVLRQRKGFGERKTDASPLWIKRS